MVLKRLAGLAPAGPEATELAERLAEVRSCVAPLAVEPRDGDLWIVYPYVDGMRPVEAVGVLGPPVGAALEQAVAELHAAGLVHGSLCDSNVRVSATGELRLLDAGLASLGALGAVSVASEESDRRDLRVLLQRMAQAAPPRGGSDRRRRRVSRRDGRRAGVIVLVTVVSVALLASRATGRSGATHPVSRAGAPPGVSRPTSVPVVAPCTTRSLPGDGAATYFAVDMDGTGCAEPMAWKAGLITTVSPDGQLLRFSLGRPGDVLLVGHWSCSRPDLPALYRTGTGQLFYLRAWPTGGRAVASEPAVQTGVRGGRPVTSHASGCERVTVMP